jgi:hypothetical protein
MKSTYPLAIRQVQAGVKRHVFKGGKGGCRA